MAHSGERKRADRDKESISGANQGIKNGTRREYDGVRAFDQEAKNA
jgi:hypothetical protein